MASPATSDGYTETNVSLTFGSGTLGGTLAMPRGGKPFAAALLLAGSGPTDRNGNSLAMGVQPNTLKLLAEGLSPVGIATLRADKRGVAASRSALASEADITVQTYVADARAWAADFKRRTGFACVWLVGHSEGALIAELAAQDSSDICGMVLLSGSGRKLGHVMREQVDATPGNPPEIKKVVSNILESLEAGNIVANVPPVLQPLFRPSVQPYLISELALNPAAILSQMKIPALILQGDNDIQTSVADAQLLAAARRDATLKIFAGVNHVLKIAPLDRAANIAAYADPDLPLAPGIVDAVSAFIQAHRP